MSVLLVSGGYDHQICFWEALTGVCSRSVPHPDSQVNKLKISHNKELLAAAGNPNIRLYNINQRETQPQKLSKQNNVNGNSSNSANSEVLATLEGHKSNVTSIQFQQDDKWLVSSSEDGTIKVWDIRSNSVQRSYKTNCPINEVVIHPNQGELISCDAEGRIKIWDLSYNKCSATIVPEDADNSLQSLSVANDGSVLIAGNNKGHCYVWDMPNHTDATLLSPLAKFRAHTTYITKLLISQDSKNLATCSADGSARVWDISDLNNIVLKQTLDGHKRWVWDCSFSADSAYLVTASSDHFVRLWDLSSNEVVRQYSGHSKGVVCVALNDI
ncbi:TOR complex subunit lst8 [Hanseniaspora valbyensis]|uniref:WD40 repeat-like protein n=1 Tax=Hanseniaspora valbyensis NRRL Y-1626 TaxID=766949 RepID=A0A1B7TKB5_9ASCO|nr:WD40 repeat-like protein [Hanseniaspora valbyensis NRRL Y-1626]